MGKLLGRGLLAGLAGGLVAFAFAHTFGETPIDQAIAFEDAHPLAPAPVLVGRGIQSSAGLLTACLTYGLALGGLFALASRRFRAGCRGCARAPRGAARTRRLPDRLRRAVPQVPRQPARVGDPDTIGRRTALYLAMIAVSILAAVVAYRVRRPLPGLAVYLALVVAAAFVLPAVHEVPKGFPPDTLWHFRLASLGTQACIWATLGLGFGALADRLLVSRNTRATIGSPSPSDPRRG